MRLRSSHYVQKRRVFSGVYDGYYKAFGFEVYPCIFCEESVAEEWDGPIDESIRRSCRKMDRVRPSMESVGMDVFATAKKVGWDIEPICCAGYEYGKIEHGDIRSVALLLIE